MVFPQLWDHPDVLLGPEAGSTLGKKQLHRELLHEEKKSFTRKF